MVNSPTPPTALDDEEDPFSLDFTKLTPDPAPPAPAPAVAAPVSPPKAAAPPAKPVAKPAPPAPAAPAATAPAPVSPPPKAEVKPAPAKPTAKPAPAAPSVAKAAPTAARPQPRAAAPAVPKSAPPAMELVPMETPPSAAEPVFEFVTPAAAAPLSAIPPSTFESAAAPVSIELPPTMFEPTPVAPPRPVKSAGQKLLEEVALLHASGNSTEACSKLETALRSGTLGNATEAGWSMLFDLLQTLNRRQAFETLADAYAKRFEKSAPAWLEPNDPAEAGLETGGAAYVALSGTLSAASEAALKKLIGISENNPTVRLGLTKVTDADNEGCRQLLETLRLFKKKKRECLISGAEEFAGMLASKIEMMRREREETWLLLLELHQQAGKQELFEDMAVGYAVTFEVSPPSWETVAPPKNPNATPKRVVKDPMLLEGEVLIGMGGIAALATAAKGKDAITIETENLQRIDEPSAQALLTELTPLAAAGMHIRIRGANMLVATLFAIVGLDRVASIETRRR